MTLNSRNQSKWDSLQDAGQTHIDRILAGRGTKEDIDAISKLLADQHELAGQIFEQGVEDAIKTANQVVNNLEQKRIESGKRGLTDRAQERLFNRAFQDVMSQAIDDILGQVHDEFEAQDQAIRDRVESALERIRAMPTPVQQARPEGPRRPADRLLGPTAPAQDEAAEEPQNRSLMNRVLDRQTRAEEQRTEVMQMIRDTAGAIRDRVTSLYDRFSRSNEDSDEERRAAIWMRRLKAMFSPFRSAWSKAKSGASKAQDLLEMIGKPLMLAVMNPQLIQSITDEVSKTLNFDNISKFVDSTWEETKKIGTDSLDWIIDKVKNLLGFGSKDKPAAKTDTVARAAQASQKVTDLPKEISPEEAKAKLPVQQSGLAQAQKQLDIATARYKASPTAANKKAVDDAQMSVNYWQSRVTMYGARAQQATKLAGSDLDKAKSLVSSALSTTSGTTSAGEVSSGQAAAAVQQATEVSNVPAPTTVASPQEVMTRSNAAAPSTQVIGDMPRFVPGKAYDTPEKQAEEKAKAEKGRAAIAQIGMGSFGFDSVDPALNILNLGMIS